MSRPAIEAITDNNLREFAELLNSHLDSACSVDDWVSRLSSQWSREQPNYGFLIRDAGKVVGGIGAFYADRIVRGRHERFCNISSWCVVDAYRQQSMRLAMSVVGQAGYHFTDFSPTKVVGGVLLFLKFKALADAQAVVLNLPCIPLRGRLIGRSEEIENSLDGESLRIYRDHAKFPWLRHVLIGTPGSWCHVIYKRWRFKGLPAARILYLSNSALFDRYFRRLSGYLLARGMISTHVDARFLERRPWPSVVRSGFNPKLFLSTSLVAEDIDYLYSETMALDL